MPDDFSSMVTEVIGVISNLFTVFFSRKDFISIKSIKRIKIIKTLNTRQFLLLRVKRIKSTKHRTPDNFHFYV